MKIFNRKLLSIIVILLFLLSCSDENNNMNTGLHGLNNYIREFDFSNSNQLEDLPIFGEDNSFIEDGKLKSLLKVNQHKALGRKFYFKTNGGEPDEAEMKFNILLGSNFQKNGAHNELSKFSGFEGIYDKSAGWGGKKVTNQKSWSIRIAHLGENDKGEIPLALYIYHPGMKQQYGTTIDLKYSLKRQQFYTLALYIKMNDIEKDNGVIIFSVDGNEIYKNNEFRFRNDDSVHIKSVWLDLYMGGKIPSKYDTYILMDDLKIRW